MTSCHHGSCYLLGTLHTTPSPLPFAYSPVWQKLWLPLTCSSLPLHKPSLRLAQLLPSPLLCIAAPVESFPRLLRPLRKYRMGGFHSQRAVPSFIAMHQLLLGTSWCSPPSPAVNSLTSIFCCALHCSDIRGTPAVLQYCSRGSHSTGPKVPRPDQFIQQRMRLFARASSLKIIAASLYCCTPTKCHS